MTTARPSCVARAMLTGVALAVLSACSAVAPPPPSAPPVPPAAAPAVPPPPAPSAALPTAPVATAPRYRCDHDIEFTVRYGVDAATVEVARRGRDELLRDAGGVTPQQTVYSNDRLRAEFGLGANGGEAILRYAQPPLVAHCVRE